MSAVATIGVAIVDRGARRVQVDVAVGVAGRTGAPQPVRRVPQLVLADTGLGVGNSREDPGPLGRLAGGLDGQVSCEMGGHCAHPTAQSGWAGYPIRVQPALGAPKSNSGPATTCSSPSTSAR